jgi:Amt family ammonium transporter
MMQAGTAALLAALVWLLLGWPLICTPSTFDGARFAHLFSLTFFSNGPSSSELAHFFWRMQAVAFAAALLGGAVAERLRFSPAVWHVGLWTVLVQLPILWSLSHYSAVDPAGCLSIHVCVGWSGLAFAVTLGRRQSLDSRLLYPGALLLALAGASLLVVGWFHHYLAAMQLQRLPLASLVTALASAVAGAFCWLLWEVHRGRRPTPLGLATGFLAGLVAAAGSLGYASPIWGIAIGATACGATCLAIWFKSRLGIDDTLDIFPLHGVSGSIGVLWTCLWIPESSRTLLSLVIVAALSCTLTGLLTWCLNYLHPMELSEDEEAEGLDRSQHGQIGIDLGPDVPLRPEGLAAQLPRPATSPPQQLRYALTVDGVPGSEVSRVWTEMCQAGIEPWPDFLAIFPHLTTMEAGIFRFRGGNPEVTRQTLERLLRERLRTAHLRVRPMTSGPPTRRAA